MEVYNGTSSVIQMDKAITFNVETGKVEVKDLKHDWKHCQCADCRLRRKDARIAQLLSALARIGGMVTFAVVENFDAT